MSEQVEDFARWIVSLDDDDPESPGRQDRRTVTLTQIVDRARAALAALRPGQAEEAVALLTEGADHYTANGLDKAATALRFAVSYLAALDGDATTGGTA